MRPPRSYGCLHPMHAKTEDARANSDVVSDFSGIKVS